MTDPIAASTDSVAVAVAAALKRRRRRWRWASVTATWTLLIASLPNVLQIEPHLQPVRLDTVRLLGPATAAGGASARGAAVARTRVSAADQPPPLYYGAFREARPSALELGAGRGERSPGVFDGEPALVSDDAANDLPPRIGGGPFSSGLSDFPASLTPIGGLGGGVPSALVTGAPPTTPPVTTNPVTTTPVITPPVIVGPVITPPVTTNPVTPPVTVDPTTPSTPQTGTPPVVDPVIVAPVSSPPVITPDGPPVVTVTTPTDPDDPGGLSPIVPGGGPASPTPEPAVWVELIVGFGGLGLVLRRRRQPPTTLRARSSALTVVSRLG